MNVYIDGRWDGDTGIGRLYKEVISRRPAAVNLNILKSKFRLGHPLSPLHLSKNINNSDGDVFYSPSFMPPFNSRIPFVITIHDLNHLYYYSTFHKFYLKHIIGSLALKAKRIITVSEFTKNEIVKKLKIGSDQIDVIYNGVDTVFSLNNDRYLFERPYFLYIGNKRKYKNVCRMLHAFAVAAIPRDYMLLLSGDSDDELEREIKLLGIVDRVKFLGNIKDHDLPKIYRGAHALLFVSLMEGFGLPILEAMASGTPVITSNITSLPEIAGNAALLVDPFEIKSISRSIEQIVTDRNLYNSLVEKGLKRSSFFNWENTCNQTWNVILK